MLLEEFHGQGKLVLEELEVKTQVLLQRGGPAHVGAVFGVGPTILVAVGRAEVDTVGAAHLVLIHEATSRGRVGTDKADGITDLEEGPDILEGLLPEGFIGNSPADTRCREETEAVVGVEVLGTVVTGIQFGEVTVVVRIGCAGGDTLLLVVQRFHQTVGRARGIDVLVIEQQARYGMLSELPVVVEGRLEIDIAVHGLPPAIAEFAAAGVGADDVPVTVGIIDIAVPQTGFRVFGAGECKGVVQFLVIVITGIVHVKGQERACSKALAPVEETQVLGNADVGIQLIPQLLSVTALGKVGQGVAQVACGGKARDGAVGHRHGQIDRVDLEGRVEKISGGLLRVVTLRKVTAEAQVHGRGLSRTEVQVGRIIIAVVTHVGVVVLHLGVPGKTALVIIREGYIIGSVGNTAPYAHLRAAVVAQRLEELVNPVHIRIEVAVVHLRIVIRDETVRFFGGLDVLRRIKDGATAVHVSLVGGIHIGIGVGQLRDLGEPGDTFIVVESEFRLTHLTGLGRDDNDAVSTAHTVDGGGRRVLEDRETLDIFGVDIVEAAFYTVDQHQRTGMLVREGGDTADPDVGLVVAGFAGTLHGDHARETSRDDGGQTGRRHLDLIRLDGSLRTDDRNLSLGTITHDDDFVQFVDDRHKRHINKGALTHHNLLLLVTEGREYKNRVGAIQGNAVLTVVVGEGTVSGSLLVHCNTCKQFTLFIRNTTGYIQCLSRHHDTRGDEHHHCKPDLTGKRFVFRKIHKSVFLVALVYVQHKAMKEKQQRFPRA